MRDLAFYLKIVDMLKDDLTIYTMTDIAKSLNISKQNLHIHTTELKKQGVLTKIGKAWRVDSKKLEHFATDLTKTKIDSADAGKNYKENTIRGHNFRFTLPSSKIPSLKERRAIWGKENINYTETKSGTWIGDKIELGGFTTRITPNSIISDFSRDLSIYGENAESIFLEATFKWFNLLAKLESCFGFSLKTKTRNEEPAYKFKSSENKHYALVNNSTAKILNDEKHKLYVRSEDGVLFLIVDFSHNVHEFEIVGTPKGKNEEDITHYFKTQHKEWEETRLLPSQILQQNKEINDNLIQMSKIVNEFAINSKDYAENIKMHMEVVRDIKRISKKIDKKIDISNKNIKNNLNKEQSTLKVFLR